MTATAQKVGWRLVGTEVGTCNCDWACPCQFNDVKPTHDFCEAFSTFVITEGHFGETDLSGIRFSEVLKWPGPVHLGDGTRLVVLDEASTSAQREAVIALTSGTQGHPFFEIFASVTPNVLDPLVASISADFDSEARTARVSIAGLAENTVGPIVGFSGQPSRVRLDLPNGFEFKTAEIANSLSWYVHGPEPLIMDHERTYTHICPVDWSSDGTTR